ncbi:MAG TPA: hypothetical protein VFH71_06625 [Rhodanobacteraceae bacterium]|nr:hypothetical protein [Rhodanobacteraceae bacterium]
MIAKIQKQTSCLHSQILAIIHDRENHQADILSALLIANAIVHDCEDPKADILSALSNSGDHP